MPTVGIGVDVVDVARFTATLARTPRLVQRLFDPEEAQLPARSLAARFAAKEALAKALGAPPGLRWRDAVVRRGEHGAPSFDLRGSVAARAAALGVDVVHLSLTHDAGIATAFVVAERRTEADGSRPATSPRSGQGGAQGRGGGTSHGGRGDQHGRASSRSREQQ